jgi:hypothetical protein
MVLDAIVWNKTKSLRSGLRVFGDAMVGGGAGLTSFSLAPSSSVWTKVWPPLSIIAILMVSVVWLRLSDMGRRAPDDDPESPTAV